jgi:hydrophobic/amphiphilic exporter-1 (mainly G- bacteria), HAE1 family
MLSKFFINRPVFASVISIVIILLGAVAGLGLPIAQYPELAPPTVRVEALYPGANAKTIADTVAAPIEQEVNGVDGMIYMSSTSSDGRYGLDVTFEVGTDVDMASVLVQNRVSIAQPKLPEEVRRLGVTTKKQSTSLAGVVALFSPDGKVDDLELSNFLSNYWRDEVARIPGVGGVNIMPMKDYSMRVWLDPERLKARGLTVTDAIGALQSQNVQVAAGALGRQPAPAGTDFEYIVNTKGRLTTAEEFGAIIIRSAPDGQHLLLRDIARIELGARDYSTQAGFNGKPNAVLVVYQSPGANLVEITDSLSRLIDRLTGPSAVPLPSGAEVEFFYDASMFVKSSMHEVLKTLIEAFVLVSIVVLVFLQSLRTTLIPLLTIPVSLIGTLLFMNALGFSINMLTMFGIVLAIGIVVDDAIVVVENVERNMAEHGLSPKEATVKAMGEITGPVIAITLVLMSVFIPTAFLPGMTGEMYRQFALTIASSTFLSAVCALTLSPALCGLILKKHDPHHQPGPIGRVLKAPANAFNWCFDRITAGYGRVAWLFAKAAPVSILLMIGVLVLTAWMYRRVPTGFVPNEDLGFVVCAAQLPDGASLERSQAVIAAVTEAAGKIDGIANVVSLAGFSVIQGNATNVANAWIVLDPWDERYSAGKNRSIEAIMGDLQQAISPMQEADFLIFSLPPISGVGNAAGFDLRLQDRGNAGRDALQQAMGQLIGAGMGQANANGQMKLLAVFSSFRSAVPQIYLDIDREKVMRLGIGLQSVFDTLRTYLGSAYVNDFNLLGRTFQVNAQAEARFRLQPADIKRLEVRNANGAMIPLGAFASVGDALGPDRVERYNLYEAATINGIPAPGTSTGEAMSIMEQAASSLPPGMGYEWTALSFQERRAGNQGAIVFLLGIVMVYLILAAQYEAWTTPLAVVFSIPLVVIGAATALWYRGLDNNVFTQIGLVLLVGLGAKNAILIVEFARENLAKGMTPLDSAVDAAKARFRPILMTSFAFILGVVPLLTATGAAAASRRALGTAVFGGMLSQTVLGLLFTPMLFVVVVTITRWISPRRKDPASGAGSPAAAPPDAPKAAHA